MSSLCLGNEGVAPYKEMQALAVGIARWGSSAGLPQSPLNASRESQSILPLFKAPVNLNNESVRPSSS